MANTPIDQNSSRVSEPGNGTAKAAGDESGHSPDHNSNSPDKGKSLPNRIWGEMGKTLEKLIAPVIIAIIALLFIGPIKGLLGISAIEDYLETLRDSVAQTEDTIFSYQFDFELPTFTAEKQILAEYDIDVPIVEILDDDTLRQLAPVLREQKGDEGVDDYKQLRRAKVRLESPIVRTFPFSAAEDALLTIAHSLRCLTTGGGTYRDPIAYQISVNGSPLTKKGEEDNWEELDPRLISNFQVVPTTTNRALRQHTLKLEVFPREDTVLGIRMREALTREAQLGRPNIERCSFNAMIFVRDNPTEFAPGGLDNRMRNFLDRTFGGS